MRKTLYDTIKEYKEGYPYEKLTLDELLTIVDYVTIRELADKYGVKYATFETDENEVRNYLYSLPTSEYAQVAENIRNDEFRMLFFCFIIGITIALPLLLYSPYFSTALLLAIFWIVYKFIYPKFRTWYNNEERENFLKKHGVKRNFKVERFIDEVMFQAYIKNRNPEIESKVTYIRHRV